MKEKMLNMNRDTHKNTIAIGNFGAEHYVLSALIMSSNLNNNVGQNHG